MKSSVIISLYGNYNYGNKLQNYALQEALSSIGVRSEVLRYEIQRKKNFKQVIKQIILKLKKKKMDTLIIEERFKNFDYFNKNIIYTKEFVKDVKELNQIYNRYDYCVVGSDQIWSEGISNIGEIAFVTCSKREKNISYAASFGRNIIPAISKEKYIMGLNNFCKISVREDDGKKIIKELIGKDVPTVLDPTMLLTVNQWDAVMRKPKEKPTKKFIFSYFVTTNSETRRNEIERIAKQYDYEVVALNDPNYEKFYVTGPSEFLYYIKNAEYIFTDSFHCAVFSILYKKNFYTLNRIDSMDKTNSRIDTLLKKFNLTERAVNQIPMEFSDCLYNNIDELINKEKEKSMNFLKTALDIKEGANNE